MEYRDYYKVLDVPRTAAAEDIKKAYRKLARRYHPDVSKEHRAEERFKEIQEAYEVLKDPQKRSAYDQLGENWKQGEQFRPPPGWTGFDGHGRAGHGGFSFEDGGQFSDFFSSLFGGAEGPFAGGAHGAGRGGRDSHADIELDLEEAYRGTTRTLTLQRAGGAEPHTVRVTIPPGVTEGQSIRLAGQGEPARGRGARAGDLYLQVHVRPHRLFRLEGRDVQLTLPVAPWEAALGAVVAVPTLGGVVDLKIPPGSQSGARLRLRGRGLPADPSGDQYAVLKVVLPEAATPQARALYERMQSELAFDPRANL